MNDLFLSVGAMKAGTTWLYENIKAHPDLLFSEEKEIHFWANRVGIENQLSKRNKILKFKEISSSIVSGNPAYISENLDKLRWYLDYADGDSGTIEWYLSLFKKSEDFKYVCDFSNLYAQMEKDQWMDLDANFRSKKVIYTLRDPIKRIWSHYKFHFKWVGKEDGVFDDGFEGFKELLGKDFFWKNAEYYKNYKNLLSKFGGEDLKILYFEDFRLEPQVMLDEVCDFLNVSRIGINEDLGNKKINSTKEFEMPDEWREFAFTKLENEIIQLKEHNLWHAKWSEF